MSDRCSSCDCSDKSQCSKGSSYTADIVETEKTFLVMDVEGAENDGNCKCGSSCACTNCSCGAH